MGCVGEFFVYLFAGTLNLHYQVFLKSYHISVSFDLGFSEFLSPRVVSLRGWETVGKITGSSFVF